MLFVFLAVVAIALCELPDPRDFNPVPDTNFDDGRKLCKRNFFKREFPGMKMILGVGASICGTLRDGLKIKSLFFMIRNGIFPFFTVGAKDFQMGEMESLESFKNLEFMAQTQHMSIAVLGFFEYKKGNDTGGGFKPIKDQDRLTEVYMLNKQGTVADRFVKWMAPRYVKVDVGTGANTYQFEVKPDFSEWNEAFPRFTMSATMVDAPIDEPKRDTLKGVRMDPSSIKISMNVTNAKCRNDTSDGFGIAMLMVSNQKTRARMPSDATPDVDMPNEESATQVVRDVEAEGYSGFMSFKKEVGLRDGEQMIGSEAFLNFVSYERVRERFGERFIYINETNKAILRIGARQTQALWLSVPGCEIDSFYWDPSVGFSNYLDQGEFEDSSSRMLVSFFLLAVSIFLLM